jgi:hypothetical protein
LVFFGALGEGPTTVRLGAWFANPQENTKWQQGDPSSLWLLFNELLGRTNRRSSYVYLSDGGHFENLSVYELARRQCRYIVACDGGEDSGYELYDLGSLIRKCASGVACRPSGAAAERRGGGETRRRCGAAAVWRGGGVARRRCGAAAVWRGGGVARRRCGVAAV